jgi:hypothetical protein
VMCCGEDVVEVLLSVYAICNVQGNLWVRYGVSIVDALYLQIWRLLPIPKRWHQEPRNQSCHQ